MPDFNDSLKKAIKTKPAKGSMEDITPPIMIEVLNGDEVTYIELSNKDFIKYFSKNATGCRITLDDGKKSYNFTLNSDEFTPNQLKKGKPMD